MKTAHFEMQVRMMGASFWAAATATEASTHQAGCTYVLFELWLLLQQSNRVEQSEMSAPHAARQRALCTLAIYIHHHTMQLQKECLPVSNLVS